MAKVQLVTWSPRTGQETTKEFKIPGGVEDRDIQVEGDWLRCFNVSKGELVYFRLPENVKRVEIQYD